MSSGELLELRVGEVGHGGVCAARAPDGRVVLVRHALPGELVRVRLTEQRASYARGDAVEVLEPAPGRVRPPCPYAGPGRCGGCDWQHADLTTQRRLKGVVVAEQLRRLAGLDLDVVVEPLPGDEAAPSTDADPGESPGAGLGWRTRVRFAVGRDGVVGFHRHRSHGIEPVDACLIAHPLVEDLGVERQRFPGATEVAVAVGAGSGDRVVDVRGDGRRRPHVPWLAAPTGVRVDGDPLGGRRTVRELAGDATLRVTGTGFWQVHHRAPEVLVAAVLDGLDVRPGERALDLYAGAGLFSHALLTAGAAAVVAVESDAVAADDARRNLAPWPDARVVTGDVAAVLGDCGGRLGPAEVVVADPPRAGLGAEVVRALAGRHPRAVGYVSCEPSALARDVAAFAGQGYRLAGLRAFDAFPMTAHVECVAVLVPAAAA